MYMYACWNARTRTHVAGTCAHTVYVYNSQPHVQAKLSAHEFEKASQVTAAVSHVQLCVVSHGD
jgi:hypothetical protein